MQVYLVMFLSVPSNMTIERVFPYGVHLTMAEEKPLTACVARYHAHLEAELEHQQLRHHRECLEMDVE